MTPDPSDETALPNVELNQIIAISLLDGSNGNPFNARDKIGVREPAYKGSSNASRAQIQGEIRRRFERLAREKRAKLLEVEFESKDVAGVPHLFVQIVFENLETGARQSVEVPVNGQ